MKMRLKYRLKSALQFIAFAFYPKTTLIACTVFSVMVISILGIVMTLIPHDSNWYNLVFAFTVGATGSFFVSFVVELRKKLLAKYANPVMLIIDEWLLISLLSQNSRISWSCCTGAGGSRLPSSAHSIIQVAGMTSWAVMTVPWQKRSSIGSNVMLIRLISFRHIPLTIVP
jgi:hypothetical protein